MQRARQAPWQGSRVSIVALIGWGAVAVLVVGWLLVSFSAPSQRRAIVEWLAATAMYVALSMLFTSLVLRAWESGNHFALAAFGFLLLVFASGLCVSCYNMLRSLRGGSDKGEVGATH
jgi:hypothetical protein